MRLFLQTGIKTGSDLTGRVERSKITHPVVHIRVLEIELHFPVYGTSVVQFVWLLFVDPLKERVEKRGNQKRRRARR